MMRPLAFGLALFIVGCQVIPPPTVTQLADGRDWVLAAPLQYRLEDTEHVIEVPQGFVTDFASIPRVGWSVMSPTGRPGRAGIVHDFLYWDQGCTREEADKIMLLGMMETDVPEVQRTLIYAALRVGGVAAWENNAEQRLAGRPREIPVDYSIPANAVWSQLRERLYAEGVRPDVYPPDRGSPAYCAVVDDLLEAHDCSWWRRLTRRCS